MKKIQNMKRIAQYMNNEGKYASLSVYRKYLHQFAMIDQDYWCSSTKKFKIDKIVIRLELWRSKNLNPLKVKNMILSPTFADNSPKLEFPIEVEAVNKENMVTLNMLIGFKSLAK